MPGLVQKHPTMYKHLPYQRTISPQMPVVMRLRNSEVELLRKNIVEQDEYKAKSSLLGVQSEGNVLMPGEIG